MFGVSDYSPALTENTATAIVRSGNTQIPLGIQSLKRENRLSAVPADQAGHTVARPHHNSHSKEMNSRGQSSAKNPLRIRAK